MKNIIQVHVYQGDKYFVAECVDLPVVTQGETLDEAVKNVHEAIALHLEGEDLSELMIADNPTILVNFEARSLKAREYAKA
ncbi:type II toxin-antitoxin system HicB family antitoxin [Candidatus Microgenomates bacterium]|nr:type II toxin-antitoxin system HicB family antitoxin [Candidatus Microgenomates bacterium]